MKLSVLGFSVFLIPPADFSPLKFFEMVTELHTGLFAEVFLFSDAVAKEDLN